MINTKGLRNGYLIVIWVFWALATWAQQAIVPLGGDASSGLSSTSFTVGQLDYYVNNQVNLGVQQPIYSFAPKPKTVQSIVGFASLPTLTVNSAFQIQGVVGGASGNPIVFVSSNPQSIIVTGNFLVPVQTGIYTITATQAGNNFFLDASPVSVVVTVVSGVAQKGTQAIVTTMPSAIVMVVGDSIPILATATSNLPVSYTLNNNSATVIKNGYLYALTTGNANLTFTQTGDANYFAAPDLDIRILVNDVNAPISTVAGIFGASDVLPNSRGTYTQSLQGKGYTYQWSYSPSQSNVQIANATSQAADITFNDGSTSGTITCNVYDSDGNLIQVSTIPVSIDNSVANAQDIIYLSDQLPEVNCSPKPSDCSNSYINSFTIGKLTNKNSGCSSFGFGDFTATGKLDSLFMGESYDALLESKGKNTNTYFGIWIDYNRNGNFSDPGEFVGSSLESDSIFKIPNLLIANDPTYVGPRRLRVKMQTTGEVKADQSCQAVGGYPGETEDYLVFIRQADRLQAPNIITPNNDGKNDLFVIRGVNPKVGNKLVIVNRWGDILFEKELYKNDWNGVDKNNNALPRGTYFYFFTNGTDKIQGFVEVIQD